MNDLKGKIALVTGSGRGIGLASARVLAEHGAHVILSDLDQESITQVAEGLKREGLQTTGIALDVASEEQIAQVVASIISEYGKIDILVNNAGIIDDTSPLDLSPERWDRLLEVNLRGAQLCTQVCARHMINQRSGKIIFISSRAGQMGSPKVAPSYSASKGGILALCKSYALFCGPYGVTCNAIAPGYILTDMTRERQDDPETVPLKRLGTAEDVAHSVYFLASSLSDYITGATIDVNGGLYIRP